LSIRIFSITLIKLSLSSAVRRKIIPIPNCVLHLMSRISCLCLRSKHLRIISSSASLSSISAGKSGIYAMKELSREDIFDVNEPKIKSLFYFYFHGLDIYTLR
jgi:hypothetical protein